MSTRKDDRDADQPGEPGEPGESGAVGAHADYLWDRSGPPDPQVAALESALAGRRWSGRLPDPGTLAGRGAASRRDRLLRALPRALAAGLMAVALLAVGLSVWHGLREPHGAQPGAVLPPFGAGSSYAVQGADGAFQVENARAADGALVPGSRLVTQADARVQLRVGPIGTVTVEPATRLRIESPEGGGADADGAGYRLYLERGSIAATIFAAPRLFQLGTPSGIAVDMGCAYTASVDEAGVTRLAVTLGQVSFETPQRKVLVPEGASVRAWPGRGPGTPVWDDAPEAFRAAVEHLDGLAPGVPGGDGTGPDETVAALAVVLATPRPRDSLSLWHLLDDALGAALRAQVYDRLAVLAPPPEGVTREGCLARDPSQLLAWRDALGWVWPSAGSREVRAAR